MDVLMQVFEPTIILRILAAALLGFALGLEREITNKYAGLRTNILVCLGACVFTILSIYAFPTVLTDEHANGLRDTARVAAQVVTGIGFIGGGTVLRHGATVFGLTTAATLWMAAAIGMACGAGMYGVGIFATVVSIVVLVSVRFFEKSVLVSSTKNIKRLRLNLCCENSFSDNIYNLIVEKYPKLIEISKKISKQNENFTKISVVLDVVDRKPVQNLYKAFQNVEGVDSIAIQECRD